jgi:hypothetical protein
MLFHEPVPLKHSKIDNFCLQFDDNTIERSLLLYSSSNGTRYRALLFAIWTSLVIRFFKSKYFQSLDLCVRYLLQIFYCSGVHIA